MISKLCFALPKGPEWIVLILLIAILIIWIKTLMEISASYFYNISSKNFWFCFVFFMPALGIIIYEIYGKKQQF